MNQYLASQGFVVLAINYRLGIGYGYEFHRPPHAGAHGASEYLDVKAAGEWLQHARMSTGTASASTADPTAAISRRSRSAATRDLFAAGVDIHGVHDMTARQRCRVGACGGHGERAVRANDRDEAAKWPGSRRLCRRCQTWRSPVLLIHGDDDRNVRFSQTSDLVQRLTKQGVELRGDRHRGRHAPLDALRKLVCACTRRRPSTSIANSKPRPREWVRGSGHRCVCARREGVAVTAPLPHHLVL